MNLPNKLTVLRIILAPLFLAVALWEFPFHYAVALLVFIAAALTDMFDGKIARARGLITNFGKFLDPLADKMLTTAAFLLFMVVGQMNVWALMLVLTREFMVTSVRLIAAKDGNVIAASMWGKA
ncbi:MAG: CDP-diacylglycerol--glycerol-3-phosphate 3-phosphatidyltransferase, partial [Clostridia bacterium]|nr:CDP-diacylglycerol--glycerol-3-phosphate 3-phosphatidyltransferase [Clostridia bacterium]